MKYFTHTLLLLLIATAAAYPQKSAGVNWKKVNVLLYTKNGKGYVHDNIPNATAAIQKLAADKGFSVTVSDDPAVFTDGNLKQYTLLLFASTNNDVFDTDAQRLAFRHYIEAGGGFVGLHSILGTERNWKWFKMMIGGTFLWHAKFQPLAVKVIDKSHPSVEGMPPLWRKSDECYFVKEMYPGIQVVMAHDLSSLNGEEADKVKTSASPFVDYYPAAWHQRFDGGTIWITTLGHDKSDYTDAQYLHHVLQGLTFVASSIKAFDPAKAYAASFDAPLP